MLTTDALRQLITLLAIADDDAPELSEADKVLAAIVLDREAAGRMMLAIASFVIYILINEVDDPDPEAAIDTITGVGDEVPYLRDFLRTMLDAARNNEKINERAIRLSAIITATPEHCGIALWILGTYLSIVSNNSEHPQSTINEFVDSCVRQQFIPVRQLRQ